MHAPMRRGVGRRWEPGTRTRRRRSRARRAARFGDPYETCVAQRRGFAVYFRKVVLFVEGWVRRCRIMKVSLRVPSFWVGLGVWATSLPASGAWVESRVIADDGRVELERSGSATIEHAVTMQIRGGPLRAFDLPLGDTEIEPLDGTVAPAQTENTGVSVPLALASRPD